MRLEIAEVTSQGKVRGSRKLVPPLDGPPTVEWGALVEAPEARVGIQDSWVAGEEGRPPRTWRVAGEEIINGTNCVKLMGLQQSEDWDRPRGDSTAWQRRDTVWLSAQLGIAYRVERVLEHRDPLRKEPTHRAVLRYDLDSRLTYPGKLFEDRVHEISQARKFWDEALPLLREPTQHRQQLDTLQNAWPPTWKTSRRRRSARPSSKSEAHRSSPARRNCAGSAGGGNRRPHRHGHPGQRVPDAVVTDLIARQSVRLHSLLGRPVLLIFYNPSSPTSPQVLGFAQKLSEKYQPGLTVVGLAVCDDPQLARETARGFTTVFSDLRRHGLHQTFNVDATPRLILLDTEGFLRGGYTGWGAHTPREILGELQRRLPKVKPAWSAQSPRPARPSNRRGRPRPS